MLPVIVRHGQQYLRNDWICRGGWGADFVFGVIFFNESLLKSTGKRTFIL